MYVSMYVWFDAITILCHLFFLASCGEVLASDSTDGVKDEDLQTMYLNASMTDVSPA